MDIMVIDGWYGREWSEWFGIRTSNIFVRGYYLQYTNFPSLSDKESVSSLIPVHGSGKQGGIKAMPVLNTG